MNSLSALIFLWPVTWTVVLYEICFSFGIYLSYMRSKYETSMLCILLLVNMSASGWNFNIFKALCKLLGQSIHSKYYDSKIWRYYTRIALWQNYGFKTKFNQKKKNLIIPTKKNYWTTFSYRTFVDKMYDIFVTPFLSINPVFFYVNYIN